MDLGARDENPLRLARTDEAVRRRERDEEARTLGAHVDRSDRPAAELILQEAARAREADVGSHGGEHDEVDPLGREPRRPEGPTRRLGGEVRRSLPVLGLPPASHPRALGQLGARRPERARQLLARHRARREVATAAEDGAAHHERACAADVTLSF